MSGEKDKWAKAMSERHSGFPGPDQLDQGSKDSETSGSEQGNEEWRAFYKAIRAHIEDMRK